MRVTATGSLVGLHVGDAIGAPYETWGPKKIATDLDARGGLSFFDYPNPWGSESDDANGLWLPAGRPTDDSDQAADLAWSLIEQRELDVEHLREALRNSVVHGHSRLWAGQATGAGGTTKKVLSDDPVKQAAGFANKIGTNGSLMRCAPLALWLAGRNDINSAQKRALVQKMSCVTHRHQHAIDACWLYTQVMQALVDESDWTALMPDTKLSVRIHSLLSDEHALPYDPGAWPARGTAEFSLYVALYSLKHADNFAQGIEMAVRVGGDTDTYAAIAGSLLGAKFGYEAIPKQWRDTILGHDVMVKYAEQIYAMRTR